MNEGGGEGGRGRSGGRGGGGGSVSLCLTSVEESGKSAASAWGFYTAGLGRRKKKSLDLRNLERTSETLREY